MTWKRYVFGSVVIAGALLFSGATTLRAEDCQKRIIKADHKLHEAIDHHGWDSPEARHWRDELNAARSWCWEHGHRWWDEDQHRWHTDRDWDEHDHDHDHH